MKLYNCPYKGDMCFLYGNCEECAFYKSMEKNRNYRKTIKNLKKDNAELQKQVDELKEENNRYAELFGMVGKDFYTVEVGEWEKVKLGVKDMIQQAVKDTAKEILEWLEKHCFFNGFDIVETYFRERYGLEVE